METVDLSQPVGSFFECSAVDAVSVDHVFRLSSGHLRCPACRSKNVCACGRSKQLKSATCRECRSESWESNSNWKGGRSREKAGYVMFEFPGIPGLAGIRMCSNTYSSQRICLAGTWSRARRCTTAIVFAMTIGPKISNSGFDPSRQVSARMMQSPGLTKSSNVTREMMHLQQPSHFRLRTLGGGGNRTV